MSSNSKKKRVEDVPPEKIVKAIADAAAVFKKQQGAKNKWKEISQAYTMSPTPPSAMPISPEEDDVEDILPMKYAEYAEEAPVAEAPGNAPSSAPPMDKSFFKRPYGRGKTLPTGVVAEPEKLEVDLFDVEEEASAPPTNEDDVEIIRRSLVIERMSERMRIIAFAFDMENRAENVINMIKCNGEPLGCYAYDCASDAYYVNCKAYVDLGAVGVSYRINSQGSSDTYNIIALPNELIEKYLSPPQRKLLRVFREKYKEPRYKVEFMQSINC